jgi:hypothetical protein
MEEQGKAMIGAEFGKIRAKRFYSTKQAAGSSDTEQLQKSHIITTNCFQTVNLWNSVRWM